MRKDLVKKGKNIGKWIEGLNNIIKEVEEGLSYKDNKIIAVRLENDYEPLFLTYKGNELQEYINIYEFHGSGVLEDRNLFIMYGHEETKLVWLDTLEVNSIYTH